MQKRIFSLFLAVALLFSCLSTSIFAVTENNGGADSTEQIADLTLSSVSVSLGSMIGLNFYIEATDADGISACIRIDGTDNVYETELASAKKHDDSYTVSALLSSVELTKEVTLSFKDASGASLFFSVPSANNAVTEYRTSVKDYCSKIVSQDGFYAKTKSAVKALMAYGYYAEKYFLGAASDISDIISEDELSYIAASTFGSAVVGKNGDGSYITDTLLGVDLNTEITFSGDTSSLGSLYLVLDSYNKIRISVKSDEAPEVSSSNAVTDVRKNGDKYFVDITEITARNLNTVYTVKINGATVNISLLSVAKLVADNPTAYGEDFVNLAKALYNYYHFTYLYEGIHYFVYEDYTKSEINISGATATINNITYCAPNDQGTNFKTKKDENGVNYLLITKADKNPEITVAAIGESSSIAAMACNQISYEFTISRKNIDSFCYAVDYTYLKANNGNYLKLFDLYEDGDIVACINTTELNSNNTLAKITTNNPLFTLRLVIDFEVGKAFIYDENGNITNTFDSLVTQDNKRIENTLEWKSLLTKEMFHFCINGGKSGSKLRIYSLKIAEGNIFE